MKTYYTSEKETHMQCVSVYRIMDNFFFVETMTEIEVEVKAGRELSCQVAGLSFLELITHP